MGGSLTGKSDVTVYAGSDGSATVTGEGGSVPYMYRIGTGNYQVSGSFDGLSAGSYIITVRDVNLCTFEVSLTISQPLIPLTANIISLVNPACPGTSTGLVTIEGWGGTAPYEYSVDGVLFNQSGTFGSLAAGTYTITVKDALMAVFDIVVTLSDPSVLNITFTSTEALCFGGSTGMATAIISGGTLPYSYSWNSDPVQTGPTATGLKAASYTVTVTDGNNCTMTGNVTIGQPASELSVSIATVRVSCAGGANGTATATAAGGTAPYSYSWQTSPVQTTQTATGLSAGTYAVTVTDANGCTTTGTELVTEPPELYISFTSTDASCPDAADGTLSLNISGGVGPFNVIWSDGNLLQSRTNLLPGTYNAVVTDVNGCAGSVNAVVGFTGTYNCVEIPHVITPNNDGFNDEWVIRNISLYPDAEVRVFNRWGKLIFRTKNISANPWDGRYNGQLVPTDSYHYILYLNDGSEPKSGVISVIRRSEERRVG